MQDLTTFIANHPILSLLAGIVFVLLLIVELMRAKQTRFSVTPLEATQKINHDNAVVIDIRPNDVFRKGHIIDAYSMAPKDILESTKKLDKFRARPLIFVCNVGAESVRIATQLSKQGYNTYAIAGGIRAWSEASMPLIKE